MRLGLVGKAAWGSTARFTFSRFANTNKSQCPAGHVERGFRVRYTSAGPVGEIEFASNT